MNVEVTKQKLLEGTSETRLQELQELNRRADVFHTPQLGSILEQLFPVWKKLLETDELPQTHANTRHRCRKVLLQIVGRVPMGEALKAHLPQLVPLLLHVIKEDNEENALLAQKTLFDLHRSYRPALKSDVPAFLEVVQQMYKQLQTTIKKQFPEPPPEAKAAENSPLTTAAVSAAMNETEIPSDVSELEMKPENPEAKSTEDEETKEESAPVSVPDPVVVADEVTSEATASSDQQPPTSKVEPESTFTESEKPGTESTEQELWGGMESFKTISEAPLLIMLLFQSYPPYVERYVPVLVPAMMRALALKAPDHAAKMHPTRYTNFLDCQVKTLSFVTYLLRGCAHQVRPYQDSICEYTVKLLVACPKDAFVLRKDIFVAARHIISTDFRRGFYAQLETLMNDDVLVGKGRSSFFQIRPLAYSTLADMIHHVRDMLTLGQVSRIVEFYGKRIHDATLPISIQTTSIRLLLNLVDISAKNEEPDGWRGRNILARILLTISGKFGTTLDNIPVALAASMRQKDGERNDVLDGGAMRKIRQSSLLPKESGEESAYDAKLKQLLQPYRKSQKSDEAVGEEEPSLRDLKSLLRTMILGIRAVIWCTAHYRNPSPLSSNSTLQVDASNQSFPLTDDERMLISKVLQNGLRCFVLYTLSENTLAEEKQMLDHFAGAFTVLEAADFRDLFIANIDLLFECILQDNAILTIPQHFLANSNVSCWFAEILLKFLITQMQDLSVEADSELQDTSREQRVLEIESLRFERMRPVSKAHRASIVLRLFKIVFGSVTLFKSNESALFPHLRSIIEACLREATVTPHPDNYLLLLRALFRSISGGKYENFYKEVFPLLSGVLSALMRLQKHIQRPAMQEVLLELCLTIPARLSSLLQYLPSLMKSVVKAILSKGELAFLGLRTLEFWVDNLNPDFLYPIMTSQDRLLTEIIEALNTHLLPPPYPYGELAMRILGKIGGRNRQYLMDPLELNNSDRMSPDLEFLFKWKDASETDLKLPIGAIVSRLCVVLRKYVHKKPCEWAREGKIDSRLVDFEDLDESESSGPSFLLEKDEKTLELEKETMTRIRDTVQEHKHAAFSVACRTLVIALRLDKDDESTSSTGPDVQEIVATCLEKNDTTASRALVRQIEALEAQRSVLHKLLVLLLDVSTDVDIGEEAMSFIAALASVLTKRAIRYCWRKDPTSEPFSTLEPCTLTAGNRGVSPGRNLATAERIEALQQTMYGSAGMQEGAESSEDLYMLLNVLLDALSSDDNQVAEHGESVLGTIVDAAVAYYDSSEEAVKTAGGLFNTSCAVFAHACYDKSGWRRKYGSTLGLRALAVRLDARWCHENLLTIVRALLFVLSDHPAEVSSVVSKHANEALLFIVEKAWQVGSLQSEETSDSTFAASASFQHTELFQMFVVHLLSAKTPARDSAKKCIQQFAQLSQTDISTLLSPYYAMLSKQTTSCNLKSLPSMTRVGYVDAMAYVLELDPPVFELTKELLNFLHDVWKLITEESPLSSQRSDGELSSNSSSLPGAASSQEYPFSLSQASELRIAAVRLFRAALLAAPEDFREHQDARNRFVGVFFRYLTGQPESLVSSAQKALGDVIQLNKRNKDMALPKELLQQCLRPVLLNLADYRKLNLPLLEGLSRLLTMLSSCFNVTLGEKLLEHLNQWKEPERIIKPGIWKRGEEPAVAAAIIDLFHLLPPNESFLEPLVQCVVELEAALPKYGSYGRMSSPYLKPLAKFLNKYAQQTVNYFLKREHLVDGRYNSLFQQLIRLPEAAPIRSVITADGGAEMLISATFVAASKSNTSAASPSPTSTATETKTEDTDDQKVQAQIQANAKKAAQQAISNAQAQGLSQAAAEARGSQAKAAYVAKAQAQANAQQALKVQSQVQVQANAQKVYNQALSQAQSQGLPLQQAQAKANQASKEYLAKAQPSGLNNLTTHHQAQQLQAQIQANAQKVHSQTLAAAQAQGMTLAQAQEKAKQAQSAYVQRAKAQAQAKLARVQSPAVALASTNATTGGPFASKAQKDALELHYQGLRLVRTVSKLHPEWLANQNVVIECLRKLWRSPARIQRLLAQDRLPIQHHFETKLLVKCLVSYCRAKPEDAQVLLDLLSVFLHPTAFDFSFLDKFLSEEVARTYSAANKRTLIRLVLRMLREPTATEELKVKAMRVLVLPVLTKSFEDPDVDNTEIMDQDTVLWALREILASKEHAPDSMQSLRIELLKLGTLLIQHMSKHVTDHRKDVIKFAWNHLKSPDLTSKLWAYVNVCRFISVYDTPPKIVLQVYVALLRTYDMDCRFLVRKAFDILLPALPTRLPSAEFIKAIKWTKKIAYEEGQNLPQLVHVWFLVVRHPALFYPFRGQFVPLMVSSLNRLAIPPSSTPDNRRLAVSIVDLIISWETTRRERLAAKDTTTESQVNKRPAEEAIDSGGKKRKVEDKEGKVSTEQVASGTKDEEKSPSKQSSKSEEEFELSNAMIDLVVNFAFRFALSSADKQETTRLSKTCGELFDKAIRLWPSSTIRLSYFDKLVAVTADTIVRQQAAQGTKQQQSSGQSSLPAFFSVPKGAPLSSPTILDAVLGILNSLIAPEVVNKSTRSVPYVVQYAPRIMKLLEPCFDRHAPDIQHGLTSFLKRMVEISPPSATDTHLEACQFYPWLQSIINERLTNAAAYQQSETSTAVSTSGAAGKKNKGQANPPGRPPNAAAANAAGKQQKLPASMVNNEAARIRFLFGHHPRMLSSAANFPGEMTVRLLTTLTEADPSFVEQFADPLLKLAQKFTKEHISQEVAGNEKGSGGNVSNDSTPEAHVSTDAFGRNNVMATPTLALVDEWDQLQAGRSNLAVNNVVRHLKKKEKQRGATKSVESAEPIRPGAENPANDGSRKRVPGGGTVSTRKPSIEFLILCYSLLSKCSLPSGDQRKAFSSLLVHCLDSSSNVPLLLQASKISATLLINDEKQLLSAKDKMLLLSKMAGLDRLNEVASVPLNDQYYDLIIRLSDSDGPHPSLLHISPSAKTQGLTNHFMSGLLAPKVDVRRQFLQRFLATCAEDPTERLQLVLQQEWQSNGTRYWPIVGTEVLLSAVSTKVPLSLRLCDEEQDQVMSSTTAEAAIGKYTTSSSGDMLDELRTLCHVDMELASELWVALFRSAWMLLTNIQRQQANSDLIKVLSSKFLKRDLNVPLSCCLRRTNAVQPLVRGIVSVSHDAPALTPELVLHLASNYGVWNHATRLCEFQVENASLGVKTRMRWIEALSTIYKHLNEQDLRTGLAMRNVDSMETKKALALEALGSVHEAQDGYYKALSKVKTGEWDIESVNAFELRLWEDRWVGTARQLCQWQLLHDFARSTQNQELLLDCSWKRGEWQQAKQLLVAPGRQAAADLSSPQTRLQRLYIAVMDNEKKPTVDALLAQTADLALQQWQGLPRVLSRTHLPLLHLFHKFVEVKESVQMMREIKTASTSHVLPNLKPAVNTWRERLPNKWEPILLWDDVLSWRSHMFQVVKTSFSWSDPQVLAAMHDSPWSVVKLAHTARKQSLPDVCLGALSKLYSVQAMDVQDAFAKLREQVSICLDSSKEYAGGLGVLHSTNLDYFSLRQKAEMFRLKALFLEALGQQSDANQTFSQCLQICDSFGKGWLSWGHFCYAQYKQTGELKLAAQTIACYLQAIHHRCNSARLLIARVLRLLGEDDSNGQLVQAFESHGKQLPIWVWIVWIPQLLLALGRPEAPQIRGLLRGLSAKFPQALYYTMRAFFLENRDSCSDTSSTRSSLGSLRETSNEFVYYRTKTNNVVAVPSSYSLAQIQEIPGLVGSAMQSLTEAGVSANTVLSLTFWKDKMKTSQGMRQDLGPVQYTEDLLNFLRKSHDALTFEMEGMLEEMITRFRPGPEEELLTAVRAVLLKCYQLPPQKQDDPAPKMILATLARVGGKLFSLQPHQRNSKHIQFAERFQRAFERDFPSATDEMDKSVDGDKSSLGHVMDRLKKWKHLLQLRVQKVGKRNSGKLPLEHWSRHLIELSSSAMEVPGQYISDSEPIKDLHPRILHLGHNIDVVLRNGFTHRRVALGGSDGRTYHFLVQYSMPHLTRTDERIMQMHLLLNRLLQRQKETKQRNAVLHVPKVIPFTPRVRLLEDDKDLVTLGDVYDLHCKRNGTDPDQPLELYSQKVSDACSTLTGNESAQEKEAIVAKAKEGVFTEACEKYVPETLLSKYIAGICSSSDAYFQFRNEFAKHLALSSFLSYALFVGDRTPHRLLFSRRTGRVVSSELRPTYASNGTLENNSAMPFRLTRNLHNFVTQAGVEGSMSIVFKAAATALVNEQDILHDQLSLFFRDDLMSWYLSKMKLAGNNDEQQPQLLLQAKKKLESQVQQRVGTNVNLFMGRVKGIAEKKEEAEERSGKNVKELLDIATSPERQQSMYSTWYPWL